MRYGLGEQTINKIRGVFAAHPSIEKAVLYGSRAKGNYKPGSDIDLTLHGDALTTHELGVIVEELDDLLLPYQIDLSLFSQIEHVKLKDHIERVGIVFYQSIGEHDHTWDANCGLCGDAGKKLGMAVKNGWKVNKLGEVCSFLNRGVAPKYTENGGVCVLNQKCIRNHKIDLGPSRRHDEQSKKVAKEKFIQPGDVLVNSTGTGTLGRVAQLREAPAEKTTVDSHVTIVRPQQGKFYTDFFGYMLILIEGLIKEAGEGCGGQTELPRATLSEKFLVQYPDSIEEQKRIVTILDEAFERIDVAIANTEKNVANARELFESYLNTIFTDNGEWWTKKSLGEILAVQPRNGWSPPANNHADQGTPVLTLSSVTGFQFKKDAIKYTSIETSPNAHYWVENGDLLITRSNTTELVGHVAICEGIDTRTIYPDLIMKMKVDNKLASTKFVYYQLRSNRLRSIIKESATGANPTMKKIKKSTVQGLPLIMPSLDRQREIACRLDELLEGSQLLQNTINSKAKVLNQLKQSLLQKAFSGELTTDFNPDTLEH